jgi:Iap family predicted aminopeptidase
VKTLPREEKRKIRAYVNLDCLGLGPAGVWISHADKKLAESYAKVARALNYPARAVNVDRVGSDDSVSFRDARIPVISIHSVTQQTWRILHSPRDTLEAVRKDDYFETYRMLCALLAYLDQTIE